MDERIITSAPYGVHIALTCKNHPNMFWNTKNIAPIGARSIFYSPQNIKVAGENECACSIHDLIPVKA